MKHAAIKGHQEHGHLWFIFKLIAGIVAGALILMLSAGGAAASEQAREEAVGEPAAESREAPEDNAVERVTMAIDLEEGGVIDLDVPGSEVRIDTWKGEGILLIVEKRAINRFSRQGAPVNIELTRRGRDVRIASASASAHRMDDLGVSFHILVPEAERQFVRHEGVKYSYSMSKLGAVLFRALSKEALGWIAH
jgi:hypothetical protein